MARIVDSEALLQIVSDTGRCVRIQDSITSSTWFSSLSYEVDRCTLAQSAEVAAHDSNRGPPYRDQTPVWGASHICRISVGISGDISKRPRRLPARPVLPASIICALAHPSIYIEDAASSIAAPAMGILDHFATIRDRC